jgi:hypothetical protein
MRMGRSHIIACERHPVQGQDLPNAGSRWPLCPGAALLAKGATMLNALLNALFGCSHRKTSFPLTPRRKVGNNIGRTETYVVCLDCGTGFGYNWQEMRLQKSVNILIPTSAQDKPERA